MGRALCLWMALLLLEVGTQKRKLAVASVLFGLPRQVKNLHFMNELDKVSWGPSIFSTQCSVQSFFPRSGRWMEEENLHFSAALPKNIVSATINWRVGWEMLMSCASLEGTIALQVVAERVIKSCSWLSRLLAMLNWQRMCYGWNDTDTCCSSCALAGFLESMFLHLLSALKTISED